MYSKNKIMTLVIAIGMILTCGWTEALTLETDARGYQDFGDGMGLVLLDDDPQSGSGGVVESMADLTGSWIEGVSGARSTEAGTLSAYANYTAAGGEQDLRLEALASWSETYLNSSGASMEGLFSLEILGVNLAIMDYAYGPTMRAGYEVEVFLDGVEIWRSRSEFVGGKYGGISLLQEGVTAAYTITQPIDDPSGPYLPSRMFAQVDPIVDQIDLGSFADGESFTLSYSLYVWAQGPGYETGAGVGIDPSSYDFGFTPGTIPVEVTGAVALDVNGRPPIPEPTSLGIIALGLTGLVIRKRSRYR